MNICYYYQDRLPWPVHELLPAHFNPTRVSALLVYSRRSYRAVPMLLAICELGSVWLHRLNLVHFQGYLIWLVSFYATP